jgi:antitoxin (DNA-binding transcriptional repressor) of toxin-antitoxin stability system
MRSVGVKVLKNKLSEYLKLVAAGETVLVTDRDRVVAEIGPPGLRRGASVGDVQLAEMVRKGWVRPPLVTEGVPPRLPLAPTRDLLAELDADREER